MAYVHPAPVFIGGCDRSGTTLLGAVLGAHSQCLCVPEAQFKVEALRRSPPPGGLDPDPLQSIVTSHSFALWGLDVDAIRGELGATSPPFPEIIACLVRRYGERIGRWPVRLWIDHTPFNVWYGATLAALFPAARFIHLVRDGRGVAASILPLDWGPASAEPAARWWSRAVIVGLALESWAPGRVLRVRYEDLVGAPESTAREITRFLGLDYEPAMLNADGFRLEYGAPHHALIGTPPDARRAAAWRHDLTPREIEIFEAVAGDVLVGLGYDLLHGARARPPSRTERLVAAVRERYQYWLRERVGARRRRAGQRRVARRRGVAGSG